MQTYRVNRERSFCRSVTRMAEEASTALGCFVLVFFACGISAPRASAAAAAPPPPQSPPSTNAPAPAAKSLAGAVQAIIAKASGAISSSNAPARLERGYIYTHEEVARVPWTVHVVKIARNHPGLELDTAMGHGAALGNAILSQQVQLIPRDAGRAVAAINGDMFQSSYTYAGDPDGLQIVRGELVSGPHPSRVCFWMDAQGQLCRTNVTSGFHVVWPNGAKTAIGLNEERESDMAVLYTHVIGPNTRAYGGRELVLTGQTNSPWLPLQAGRTYTAVVKGVNEGGNTPVARTTMVLSIGPSLLSHIPKVTNGSVLRISMATSPDLTGAKMAMGGGPTLVAGGKPWHWPGFWQLRHPRSAVGWNKDFIFMVEVDGRQISSIGMTFAELATYMIKLGCEEAINLDGGGSATLWVDGRVVNSPSQGYERPSANSVVLMERPRKQP
jgi:hypothetical protein